MPKFLNHIDGSIWQQKIQINRINFTRNIQRVIPTITNDDKEYREFLNKIKVDDDLPIVNVSKISQNKIREKNKRFTSQSVTKQHPYLVSATPDSFLYQKPKQKLRKVPNKRRFLGLKGRPITGVTTYFEAISENSQPNRAMTRARKLISKQELGATNPIGNNMDSLNINKTVISDFSTLNETGTFSPK